MSRPLTSAEYDFLKSALERRLPETHRLLHNLPEVRVVKEELRDDVFVKALAGADEKSARQEIPLRSLDLHGEYQDLDGHLIMIDIFVDTSGNLREMSLWKGAPTPIEDINPDASRIALKDE